MQSADTPENPSRRERQASADSASLPASTLSTEMPERERLPERPHARGTNVPQLAEELASSRRRNAELRRQNRSLVDQVRELQRKAGGRGRSGESAPSVKPPYQSRSTEGHLTMDVRRHGGVADGVTVQRTVQLR